MIAANVYYIWSKHLQYNHDWKSIGCCMPEEGIIEFIHICIGIRSPVALVVLTYLDCILEMIRLLRGSGVCVCVCSCGLYCCHVSNVK